MSEPVDVFSTRLINWQRQNGRHDLPWQKTRDAYRIWLSEIMLQQTQVSTVIPYYSRFLSRFPAIGALAQAPLESVLELWAGLGYYARGRNLHKCARIVAAELGGEFPRDPLAIAELPGIGRSTAAAISVFAFGTRSAILDGNVKRVLARCFGIEGFPGSSVVDKEMWRVAHALLPDRDIEGYTQGLMDLGSTLCTRGRPEGKGGGPSFPSPGGRRCCPYVRQLSCCLRTVSASCLSAGRRWVSGEGCCPCPSVQRRRRKNSQGIMGAVCSVRRQCRSCGIRSATSI